MLRNATNEFGYDWMPIIPPAPINTPLAKYSETALL